MYNIKSSKHGRVESPLYLRVLTQPFPCIFWTKEEETEFRFIIKDQRAGTSFEEKKTVVLSDLHLTYSMNLASFFQVIKLL